jgi:hypothetical protein
MDGHREIDASLDREIESLLASEPPPEFVARVRTRVASEPAPGAWRASWMFAAAGAVAAVIVAVMAWPSPDAMPSNDVPVESARIVERTLQRARQITESAPAIAPRPVPLPERVRPAAVRAVAATVERDRRIEIDLPEVVIADNEVRGFRALMAKRSVSTTAAPITLEPDALLEIKESPALRPIVVEPIEVEPMVKLATALQSEGERP